MRVCLLGCMLLCSAFWSSAASAQQVPRLDIEATCRAAQPLTAEDSNPYESCMRDETDAERQLKGMWSGAAAAHRQTCAQEAQIGGTPSYVDMLTCLQIAQGATPTPSPRRRSVPQ
jgi:hypothetical protein